MMEFLKLSYTVPKNQMLMWEITEKFKSKSDIEYFLTKSLKNKDVSFYIQTSECSQIVIHKNGDDWQVCHRNGNLKNPFNPEFCDLTGLENAVKTIYKYRKAFNEFFKGE